MFISSILDDSAIVMTMTIWQTIQSEEWCSLKFAKFHEWWFLIQVYDISFECV